ncbi:hypothetical protein [Limnohabitans sp. DM1]|uniref:hypothetical protein n=1 Tax=Limnohabitans sp. DM1 TaxID=1597955 RepID=UPI001892930C|nr:hypothetical protein [Limnohabitans sp. DM1]
MSKFIDAKNLDIKQINGLAEKTGLSLPNLIQLCALLDKTRTVYQASPDQCA